MIGSREIFMEWIMANANPKLKKLLKKLTSLEQGLLYRTYRQHADLKGNYELMNFLTAIGQVVPELIKLVEQIEMIKKGTHKKYFVIENTLLLTKLIDNGISGEENNIKKSIPGFENLGKGENSLQEKLVRPQVEAGLDEIFKIWKKYDTPIV